jgi:hypothetical protein
MSVCCGWCDGRGCAVCEGSGVLNIDIDEPRLTCPTCGGLGCEDCDETGSTVDIDPFYDEDLP